MISYEVRLVERKDIRDFIELWHYSHNINGVISDYCFGLYDEYSTLIGAMIYGRLAMANQHKKYTDNIEDIIELRRLACIDDTPKNTESYFIGQTLKWLSKNTSIKVVLSYADSEVGHSGIIYKASNFTLEGMTQNQRVIVYQGKQYHDKAIRTKYKGNLKPFAQRIKEALDTGEAVYKKVKGKYVFTYQIRRKSNPNH